MKGVLFKLLYKCGVCFYVTAVAIGCMSWQLWGCFCHDPAHGHPNEWNIVHTAFGPYVHTCQIGVAALLGIPWCAAVGAAVAVNLYVTVPVLLYVGSLYNKRTALRCLVLGLLAGAAQAAALQWGVAGLDILPGFGLSGVLLGGVLVAALGASLSSRRWPSSATGRTTRSGGCAARRDVARRLRRLRHHRRLPPPPRPRICRGDGPYRRRRLGLQARAQFSARNSAARNFLTLSRVRSTGVPGRELKKGRAFLAFLAPLFLGAATSVALELSGLTLPPLYGSGMASSSPSRCDPLDVRDAWVTPGLHHVRVPPRPARDRLLRHRGRREAALAHRVVGVSLEVILATAAIPVRGATVSSDWRTQ